MADKIPLADCLSSTMNPAYEFFVPVARPKKLSGQLTIDAFGGPKKQQPWPSLL
jgi:hypothetical protein